MPETGLTQGGDCNGWRRERGLGGRDTGQEQKCMDAEYIQKEQSLSIHLENYFCNFSNF